MQRKPLFLLLVSLLVVSFLLNACSESISTPDQGPIEVIDSLGQTITLAAPAQRIVSLAPSNTEILFAIEAGSQVSNHLAGVV